MMKYAIILSASLLIFLQACHLYNEKESPLKPGNLISQIITVDITKDTTIHTQNGSVITIPAGCLQQASGNTVQLEIKEARTIYDMVMAGLVTRSDGKPLSSGGMIYINALGDNKVTITKPISISMPSNYLQNGMQLYKGRPGTDGNMNWTDPTPLQPSPQQAAIDEGKVLFNANCASCHNGIKDATGPALAGIAGRRDWKWLVDFTHNPTKMIAEGDPYAMCLYDKWGHTTMTAFSDLDNAALSKLYGYLENEGGKISRTNIRDYKKTFDSCQRYNNLRAAFLQKRKTLVHENGNEVDINPYILDTQNRQKGIWKVDTGYHLYDATGLVVQVCKQSVYYKFTIQEFGWFNIDMLFKDIPGFEDSKLTVQLVGEYKDVINMYLILPARKINIPGGVFEGKENEYGFFKTDGSIPLPQNEQAYILALGEQDSKLFYGLLNFTTSHSQALQLKVSASTIEAFNEEMKKLNSDTWSVKADKSKNAIPIGHIDKVLESIEKYKPAADCNCGIISETDSSIVEWK